MNTPDEIVLWAATRLRHHASPYCIPMSDGQDNGGGFVTSHGDTERVTNWVISQLEHTEASNVSDEIKAALERRRTRNYPKCDPDNIAYDNDAYILAEAYEELLAAREAELAEREKGIDEEWLLSIGFDTATSLDRSVFLWITNDYYSVQVQNGKVYLCNNNGTRIQIGVALTTKRGMMLDTLAGLKIPTKQHQNDTPNPETEVTNA